MFAKISTPSTPTLLKIQDILPFLVKYQNYRNQKLKIKKYFFLFFFLNLRNYLLKSSFRERTF